MTTTIAELRTTLDSTNAELQRFGVETRLGLEPGLRHWALYERYRNGDFVSTVRAGFTKGELREFLLGMIWALRRVPGGDHREA